MRFIQFLRKNCNTKLLGVLSEDGNQIFSLSNDKSIPSDMITFISGGLNVEEFKSKIANQSYEDLNDDVTLLPPITNPEKIVCIGLNYQDHCDEQKKPRPKEPMFFSKYTSTLVGPTGNIIAHKITEKIDWEVELAVVIGKEAKHVSKDNAFDYVFGYTVAQDISARDWQKDRNGGQFLIGKSMDTFCPLGPAIVHKSLIANVNDLNVSTKVNGVLKQTSNTKNLIYKIDDIIHELTKCITLKPGDIILTGTPGGVGMARDPPEFLKPGDVLETEIQSLGKMCNTVIADQ